MAFEPVRSIEVSVWGETVGAIAASSDVRTYAFEFARSWLRRADPIELSPILMPNSRRIYTFENLPEPTFQNLPPMIADALPDKFGSAIVNTWLERNGVPLSRITPLDRLAYLGDRGMGALEFSPASGPTEPEPSTVDLLTLVRAARDVISGRIGDEDESEEALRQIISVGTSAGGARAKAIINYNQLTGEIRPGHRFPDPGFESWLLKFDGVGVDLELGTSGGYGRIEHAYALMARAAGIDMAETELIEEHGRAHFMSKRFDRDMESRKSIHMSSLCALIGADFNAIALNDYAQLQSVIRELDIGDGAPEEAFRRMVFNYVAANCDDHTKNHAFLLPHGGNWQLSPAYDVTHAYNPDGEWTFQHLMGIDGKFRDVSRRELMAFAERHDVLGAKSLIEQVNAAVADWPRFAEAAGIPSATINRIQRDHSLVA